jgi:hypothetical protein
VLLAGFLSFPTEANAMRNAYRCNGCTESQYYSAAIAPQELGVRYVYDFANSNIRKYQVTGEPNGNGFTYHADPLTVISSEQAYFDAAVLAWNSNGSSLKTTATLVVTPTTPGVVSAGANAYEIVRTSSMQNSISDWIAHAGQSSGYPSSFGQGVRDLIALLRTNPANIILEDNDTGQLTLTLIFTNNHKVTFVWKKGSAPVMTEARDGNNNTIPTSASGLNGRQFNFGGGGPDMGYFGEHVDILGAVYENVCGGTILACVSGEGFINCTPYPSCP